ncbi:MAG: hypothetical protein ACF8QF_04220 [Phycisphaerales bacterium]
MLRRVGLLLTAIAVAAVAIIMPAMARKVGAHREQVSSERWAVRIVSADTFEYFSGVEGRVEEVGDAIRLEWGDDAITVPIGGENVPGLPGLRRYKAWFAVLAMAPVTGDIPELEKGLADGTITERLVAVARQPAPRVDPETWGVADTSDWRYLFWTLTPEGALERFDEPYTYTYYGEEVVEAGYRSYKALKRLPSSSWQFVAAMEVTPGLHTPAARNSSPISYPNYAGVRDDINAMGWTWPASGVAFLVLIVGVLFLSASFVRREDKMPPA